MHIINILRTLDKVTLCEKQHFGGSLVTSFWILKVFLKDTLYMQEDCVWKIQLYFLLLTVTP